MLRIRTVSEANSPADRATLSQVQEILRAQFPGLSAGEVDKLPDQVADPLTHRFLARVLVAETDRGETRGFAVLLHATDLRFAYLETISAAPGRTGGGIGSALYEAVREEAAARGANGIYFECLPDDPALCRDAKVRRQNAARLQFYERFGARPISGTDYETPFGTDPSGGTYLVFDGLDRHALPGAARLKSIVRAILERKYGDVCPPGYIDRVAASIRQGRYSLRPPRYEARATAEPVQTGKPLIAPLPLVVSERHAIHHVRERGYVEAPVRVAAIQKELDRTGHFAHLAAKPFPDRWIREVHNGGLVDYIERACAEAPERRSIYPYVFPIRNRARRPKERSVLAGYWCIDTFTPLNRNAYPAARHAVDCVLTAAEAVAKGAPAAYALVRPPGHHAERNAFGGFCYFSNAAIAANYLSRRGKVAILDIDYHHGNGQQDIFYERADVLTVSVHGHPNFAYPYFTGFADERGRGAGAGFNLNIPLEETITPEVHRAAIARALRRIERFAPAWLVLALGYDTARGDPTGTWANRADDFVHLGRMIGETGLPILIVQEGGYRVQSLGANARGFCTGLVAGLMNPAAPRKHRPAASVPRAPVAPSEVQWRDAVGEADIVRVRDLVAGTGMFTTAEVEIAAELVDERVRRGRASGYEFLLAEDDDRLLGYACYGPTPATDDTCDLYWIVVRRDAQGRGLGRAILARVEEAVRARGGRRLYVDTSSTEQYAPTRAYYRRTGFRKVAELDDFYRAGDAKVVYLKTL